MAWRDLDLSPSCICSIARLSDASKLPVLVSSSLVVSMHTLPAAPAIPFPVLTTAVIHYLSLPQKRDQCALFYAFNPFVSNKTLSIACNTIVTRLKTRGRIATRARLWFSSIVVQTFINRVSNAETLRSTD